MKRPHCILDDHMKQKNIHQIQKQKRNKIQRRKKKKRSDSLKYFVCQLLSRLPYLFIYFRAFVCLLFFMEIESFYFNLFTAHCEREWIISRQYTKECASEKKITFGSDFNQARSMHQHLPFSLHVDVGFVHFLKNTRECSMEPDERKKKFTESGADSTV